MSVGFIAGLVSIILVCGFFLFGVKLTRKALAVYMSALVVPYALVFAVSGYPRPSWMGTYNHIAVVSFVLNEGKAIYLWVLPEGSNSLVSLERPWNEKEANELIKTLQKGETMTFKLYGPTGTMEHWDIPQIANPPKNGS